MDTFVIDPTNINKIGIKEIAKKKRIEKKVQKIKRLERNIKAIQMVLATVITVYATRNFLYFRPLLTNTATFMQAIFLLEAIVAVYFGIRTLWYGFLYLIMDN